MFVSWSWQDSECWNINLLDLINEYTKHHRLTQEKKQGTKFYILTREKEKS